MFETRVPQASRTEPGQSAPNRLVGFIAGRRTKWLVRVLWIVALVGLSPFSSKLAGAQKNDAVQYLPSSAESTKVFNQTKAFIGDTIPTSIIYQRTTGITGADRAKIAADVGRIDTDVLGSQSPGAKVTESGDGQAVLVNLEVPANGTIDR